MKLRRLAIVALVVAVALGAVTPGFKVDKQLGSIAGILTTSEQRLDGAAATEATVDTALGGLATTYADLITTVNGYVTDDGVHDELEIGRQQRLAEYIASRATLKARSEAAVAFQAALTEYGPAAVKAKLAELDVAAVPRLGKDTVEVAVLVPADDDPWLATFAEATDGLGAVELLTATDLVTIRAMTAGIACVWDDVLTGGPRLE